MNIAIGDLLEGLYWDSGIVEGLIKSKKDFNLYTSGTGSLIGIFYGMYGETFFGRLKTFLLEKENHLKKVFNINKIYSNRYSQASLLWKLGGGKLGLYNQDDLKKYLNSYFKDLKIKDLKNKVRFEVFNIKTGKNCYLNEDTKLSDVLLMELSITPFYKYYEYNDGFYIASSKLGFVPIEVPEDTVYTSYEYKICLEKPKNASEILLKSSFLLAKKNFELITENHKKILPFKVSENPFNIQTFFDGVKAIQGYLEENQ